MTTLLIIGLIAVLLAIWVLWLRPWLRDKSWAQPFFAFIEPIEITLWRKSETILWARFKQVIGLLLTLLTSLGHIDLSPVAAVLPERWRWILPLLPLSITVVGWMDEQLRKDITKPLTDVERPAEA